MTLFTFRPIGPGDWPGPLTDERQNDPFRAGHSDTLDLLERELAHLDAQDVVVQLALREADLRRDGMPRATSRPPEHPGVILAFESKHGPLRYACDTYDRSSWRHGSVGWQANLRAIALGLEALRKVDRYGITKSGEQYRGWQALPPGTTAAGPAMSVDAAARFIVEQMALTGAPPPADVVASILGKRGPDVARSVLAVSYRAAAKKLHPDVGGDPELFRRLQQAKDLLDSHIGGGR